MKIKEAILAPTWPCLATCAAAAQSNSRWLLWHQYLEKLDELKKISTTAF
jgi:membrane protein required for beta-lactamase induction